MTATAVPFDLDVDPRRSERAAAIRQDIIDLATRHGLSSSTVVEAVLGLLGEIPNAPKTEFETPPEYVRQDVGVSAGESAGLLRSTHAFFDVVAARTSRRDYTDVPMARNRLDSLLHWSFGKRGEVIAYNFRDAPLRYVPSAGGLCAVDAYVIANNVVGLQAGSYYYDYTSGLRLIVPGYMARRVADANPGQEWVGRAAAFVVFVGNTQRVAPKYAELALKLLLLDAGIAAGHAELVATALELRACLLGGVSAELLSSLLRIDGRQRVPLAALAVGTRGGL